MSFLNDNFLLDTKTAQILFHNYAEKMPIIDFHCHLDPKEIFENKKFKNMTRIWLNDGNSGDHYKWRLMRANGVSESLITGNGEDYQKFLAWAKTLEKSPGNPLYEWSHLELRRFFGITSVLNSKTAPKIWEEANNKLLTDEFRPRKLIRNSRVKVVCTTDDPTSGLTYHRLLKKDENQNGFKVLPAMRPDMLIHIENANFSDYIQKLSGISNTKITNFKSLIAAIKQRFTFFNSMGGRLSDHSLETFHFVETSEENLDKILSKRLSGSELNAVERDQYVTMLIINLMKLNNEFNWTMQFHINAARNLNQSLFKDVGPNAGADAMGTQTDIVTQFQKLFSRYASYYSIPKTIVYSLNPNDWTSLLTTMQSFQGAGIQNLQLGAGWWFNDTETGITRQLTTFADQSLLSNFVGMLTDSRSFLSYPRHEYFRRVLCNYLGHLVEQGRIPDDHIVLGRMVQDISYNNAYNYFGFFN